MLRRDATKIDLGPDDVRQYELALESRQVRPCHAPHTRLVRPLTMSPALRPPDGTQEKMAKEGVAIAQPHKTAAERIGLVPPPAKK